MTPPEQPEADNSDRDPAVSGGSAPEPEQAESQRADGPADESRGETEETGAAQETGATAEQADVREGAGDQAEQSSENAAPKRRRTGVLVGVAAALVLVLGGGAALFFVLGGGASAESVAEEYVALSDREAQHPADVSTDDYRPLVCEKAMPQIEQLQQAKQKFLQNATPQQLEELKKIKTNVKGVEENGDTVQATFESITPGQQPQTSKLNLVKEEGDWKLCTG